MNGDLYITSTLAGCLAHLPIFPIVKDLQGKQFHSCPWSPILCLKTNKQFYVMSNRKILCCSLNLISPVFSGKIKSSWPSSSAWKCFKGLMTAIKFLLSFRCDYLYGLTEKARCRHCSLCSWQTSFCGNEVTRKTVKGVFGYEKHVGASSCKVVRNFLPRTINRL